jgi:hypothetical protein
MESENTMDASCVGTPDYLAPEIFLATGHGTDYAVVCHHCGEERVRSVHAQASGAC